MGHSRLGRWLGTAVVTFAVLGTGATLAASGAAAATTVTTTPVGDATTAAVAAATAAGLRVAVAVTDTTTGTTTVAGEADAEFPSESVVKVLIAARLLVDGQMTGDTADEASEMIRASDDGAADSLWGSVGGPDVVTWAAQRYGVTGLDVPSEWGWWGNTQVSATALTGLYTAVLADPVVAPWLLAQMAASTPTADDGTDQTFGFGADVASGVAAVKQGWGGDDDSQSTENLLSTGYLDDHRFAVAVIVQDPDGGSFSSLVPTVDAVAAAVVTDTTATLQAAAAATAAQNAAAAQAATAAAAAKADDEVVPSASAPRSASVGGASGPIETGAWWPNVLVAMGTVTVLGAATAGVSVVSRRRATAPRS